MSRQENVYTQKIVEFVEDRFDREQLFENVLDEVEDALHNGATQVNLYQQSHSDTLFGLGLGTYARVVDEDEEEEDLDQTSEQVGYTVESHYHSGSEG